MSQRRLFGEPNPLAKTQPMFADGVRKEITMSARAVATRLRQPARASAPATSRTRGRGRSCGTPPNLAADGRVRDRRELEDQRRREEDETDRDLVEMPELPAARREDEHHERSEHRDERENVHARLAPEVRPIALLRHL